MNQVQVGILLLSVYAFNRGFTLEQKHECVRPCLLNTVPKTCEYHFSIEWYRTLSKACWDCPQNISHCSLPHCVPADGKVRAFMSINRQLPGPNIEVCEGDTIVVHVTNKLEDSAATTIHWHGMHMRNTPYMDGTSMVTQCPILQGQKFRYEFKPDPAGTHWYHAHAGLQREDGLFGALVVRQTPDADPHASLYDDDLSEHVVTVTDWYPEPAVARYVSLMHDRFDLNLSLSGLINGKNIRYQVDLPDLSSNYTPPEVFYVSKGRRYRFRVISAAGMQCYFRLSVDNHNMTVMAGDGKPFQAVQADVMFIGAGERYDFVLHANQDVGNYWFRGQGHSDCRHRQVNLLAVLRYDGAPEEQPPGRDNWNAKGTVFEPTARLGRDPNNKYIQLSDLRSVENEDFANENVDAQYHFALDYNNNDNVRFNHPEYYPVKHLPSAKAHYTPVIDNLTHIHPPVPLLTQWAEMDDALLCNRSSMAAQGRNCYDNICPCVHVVHLPKDKLVEMVIVYQGSLFEDSSHPMHMHGTYFRLMAYGKVGHGASVPKVLDMLRAGNITMKYKNPIYRDNVVVPSRGYIIIRFRTDNPGMWFFHCHTESHVEQGMGLVLKVGDVADFSLPPPDFPQCRSWGYNTAPPDGKEGTTAPSGGERCPCVNGGQRNQFLHHIILKALFILVYWPTLIFPYILSDMLAFT